MPLTDTGFKRRTFDEILTDKIAKAKELFGEDIETGELTVFGKFLRINAYDQAIAEEELEQVYYSIFPNTAFGTSLDRLCIFAGIQRNAATKAKYTVTFTGTAGAIIPAGFLVCTESKINFATLEDVTIGEDGTVSATVECEESGEIGNVLIQAINEIANPSSDVESVQGVALVAKGEETESDYKLRERFNAAKEGLGASNEVAIKSALLRIPTVTHAGVIVDEAGGSFECYLSGGLNYHKEIAETIFEKKPIGIKTTGNITQEIIDSSGNTQTIKFSHTSNITVYVRAAIKTSTLFESTGKQQIKSNLEAYIDNIGISNPVILSALYGQIHSVAGVTEVTELLLSTDGQTWFADNITEVAEYENCVCVQVEIKQDSETDYGVVA